MKRLAIFAHYDAKNLIRKHVVFYLRSLRAVCDEIAFVSTSRLSLEEFTKIAPWCAQAFTKENVGYDFGMWQYALQRTDLSAWDELVLANSSVLGPLCPLAPIMDRMTASSCDFWGMTDNHEIAWHIQSYFLVFTKTLLQSPAFLAFWKSVLPYRNKDQVIRSYEVGLSTYLVEQGFRADVHVATNVSGTPSFLMKLRGRRKRDVKNPFFFDPLQLLRRGSPFLKIELLRDNPSNVDLQAIKNYVCATGGGSVLADYYAALHAGTLSRYVNSS